MRSAVFLASWFIFFLLGLDRVAAIIAKNAARRARAIAAPRLDNGACGGP